MLHKPEVLTKRPQTRKPWQSLLRSGSLEMLCEEVSVPDRNKSLSDKSDSQTDHIDTPRGTTQAASH